MPLGNVFQCVLKYAAKASTKGSKKETITVLLVFFCIWRSAVYQIVVFPDVQLAVNVTSMSDEWFLDVLRPGIVFVDGRNRIYHKNLVDDAMKKKKDYFICY